QLLPGLEGRNYGDQIVRHERTRRPKAVVRSQRDRISASRVRMREACATRSVRRRGITEIPRQVDERRTCGRIRKGHDQRFRAAVKLAVAGVPLTVNVAPLLVMLPAGVETTTE